MHVAHGEVHIGINGTLYAVLLTRIYMLPTAVIG